MTQCVLDQDSVLVSRVSLTTRRQQICERVLFKQQTQLSLQPVGTLTQSRQRYIQGGKREEDPLSNTLDLLTLRACCRQTIRERLGHGFQDVSAIFQTRRSLIAPISQGHAQQQTGITCTAGAVKAHALSE
eukprot:6473655-Amphidinium_carterae.4